MSAPYRFRDFADADPVTAPEGAAQIATLVTAAQRGDQSAFAELYRRHASLVRALLLARSDPSDVPDLSQDVFLFALTHIKDLRDPAAFPGWISTIARNTSRARYRSSRPNVELDPNIESAPSSDDARIDAERVLNAIRAMPETLREPLLLRLLEGMSGLEIADALGVSHSLVRVNLHRGMAMLRRNMGES
ncbi:MAG TPA: sigma-70 family RNA polymerase sigma factor [Gemmatimonadaceae bacterium]